MQKVKIFVKITQVKVVNEFHTKNIGASPSGKATDSDSVIRVFESLRPSQKHSTPRRCAVFLFAAARKKARIAECSREKRPRTRHGAFASVVGVLMLCNNLGLK